MRGAGANARYGSLAGRAAALTVPRDVPLKDPSRYRLIGTRVSGADNHKVVTGQPLFGIDVRLPNMKFAAVAKCPVFNGRPVKIDATKARQVPGVRDIVEINGLDNPTQLMPGVAVVADSTWAAFKGRDALIVQWDEGPYATESSTSLTDQFQKLLAAPPATLHNSGRVDEALASAVTVVDSTYSFPFASHATLEPHNCTADYRDGELWIRGPIQMPMSAQTTVARATGIEASKVHVQSTRIGGGFGRRLMSDYAAEAAVVAKAIGGAVMVIDNREGDLQHDYYRPAAMQRLRAGVDASGQIIAWDHVIASCSRNVYRKDPRGAAFDGNIRQLRRPRAVTRSARRRSAADANSERPASLRQPADRRGDRRLARTRARRQRIHHRDDDRRACGARRSEARSTCGSTCLVRLPMCRRARTIQSPYDPARMRRVLVEVVERGGFGKPAPEGRARGLAMHHTFGRTAPRRRSLDRARQQ